MNWQAIDITIIGPAFVAGLLIISTHVPLGQTVLKRGIIFIDLAIAQIAGLGVIAADSFGFEGTWQVQISAVSAALLGALVLHWFEKRFPDIQEALIGITFVLAATLGMLMLANNPHGGEQLKELLVGQILWISYDQLISVVSIYAGILALWFYLDVPKLHAMGFYFLFAVTVTVSVQLVGVYLVFASLIIPALATRHLKGRVAIAVAYLIGIMGYLGGLILSSLLDYPSGAVIVWALAITAIIASSMASSLLPRKN